MRKSGLRQKFKRRVVIHIAIFLDDTAMAMTHVFAKAHIGNHEQFRELHLDATHRTLHNSVVIVSGRSDFILIARISEQKNRLDAKRDAVFKFLQNFVNRETKLPRHRRDFFLDTLPLYHEHRVDERIWVHCGFRNHIADRFILA